MRYISFYESPLGPMTLAAEEEGLTGLWFKEQKYYGAGQLEGAIEGELPVLQKARQWLDGYFSGQVPKVPVPLCLEGTPFQKRVWEALLLIPYGEQKSYGKIAGELGTCARAVGAAVGKNPISLIVPCHRVLGSDGSLTGYAGGTERKRALLELEKGLTGEIWNGKKA